MTRKYLKMGKLHFEMYFLFWSDGEKMFRFTCDASPQRLPKQTSVELYTYWAPLRAVKLSVLPVWWLWFGFFFLASSFVCVVCCSFFVCLSGGDAFDKFLLCFVAVSYFYLLSLPLFSPFLSHCPHMTQRFFCVCTSRFGAPALRCVYSCDYSSGSYRRIHLYSVCVYVFTFHYWLLSAAQLKPGLH